MTMYDILTKKKHGEPLTAQEIAFFVNGYTNGTIPDYQASALTMAICLKGMTADETAALTECMARSGDTMDLSRFGTLTADKHSTGGVGDKTSLIVAPLVAALGGNVCKMSGRGLGHTGGTVDKLESIPGYNTALSVDAFLRQVEDIGVAVIGQTGHLAPADKQLYALRDVTATVDSIPLIASSIMSKKLAAGAHTIVLDVKVGSGAFMKTPEEARRLAQEMVRIGQRCGRRMAAVLTDMSTPLGHAVGNALELKEAIAVLRGKQHGALRDVCVVLASQMVALLFGWEDTQAETAVRQALDSGAAFQKMREWIAAQGGDVRYIDDPTRFPTAAYAEEVLSPADGYLTRMDAEAIGTLSVLLGAGRIRKEDTIDHSAGLILHKTTGDAVRAGEPLATIYTNKGEVLPQATTKLINAVTVASEPPNLPPLIYEILR